MGHNTAYINGVIAVKEKSLLGEKLLRFCEMTAEEVLRTLAESGFGADAGGVAEEERALDAFIREYAPTEADRAYFLAPRDFHNLKALYKAARTGADPAPMLGPEGLYPIRELETILTQKRPPMPEIEGDASGEQVGAAFEKAMFSHLFCVCGRRGILKKLLIARADMTNLLTAFRAGEWARAEALFVGGGTIEKAQWDAVFSEDPAVRAHALAGTPYEAFYAACLAAGKTPYTDAERMLESFEEQFFYEKRFGLEGRESFLYYVFRRRAEIRNVRTVLVCLKAGVPAKQIKRRLAGVQ